jgi:hypothetical protein
MKEASMLLHLPIVILATLSPVAVSDTVPQFDIARECRFEGGSAENVDRCSQDEAAALGQLKAEWTQLMGADKSSCLSETTIGGFASYVELLTCVEIAHEARQAGTGPRGSPTTDSMRRAGEAGATVGMGRDSAAPGGRR